MNKMLSINNSKYLVLLPTGDIPARFILKVLIGKNKGGIKGLGDLGF